MISQGLVDILTKSIIIFLISFITSIISTPIFKYIGIKYNLLDHPEARKHHRKPIVRIGGSSILLGFLISLLIIKFYYGYTLYPLLNNNFELIFYISILLYFTLGFLDDLFKLSQ